MNTYYQFRYEAEKYRSNSVFGKNLPEHLKKLPEEVFLKLIYKQLSEIPMETAMETPSDQFKSSNEYGLISYIKTALWLYLLEASIGRDKLDLAMKNYYQKWKFKHPQPADMQLAFEEAIGGKLDQFFDMVLKVGKF